MKNESNSLRFSKSTMPIQTSQKTVILLLMFYFTGGKYQMLNNDRGKTATKK